MAFIFACTGRHSIWVTHFWMESFRPVKIFRRTGQNSFAVQVQGCPGVTHVFCSHMDWDGSSSSSSSSSHSKLLDDLEYRLCKLGTCGMFAWDDSEHAMRCNVKPIAFEEGVQVRLGQYDASRHAFVQCSLRFVPKSGQGVHKDAGKPCQQQQGIVRETVRQNGTPSRMQDQETFSGGGGFQPSKRPRRAFKWIVTGGRMV